MRLTGNIGRALLGASGMAALVGGLSAAAPASAQQVSDVIVVTAQKREESLQDVPLSVTAIGGDQI